MTITKNKNKDTIYLVDKDKSLITFEGHDLFALLTGLYGLYFLFVLSI